MDSCPCSMMSRRAWTNSANGLPASTSGGRLPSPNIFTVRHSVAACLSVRYWSTDREAWVPAWSPKA